MITGGSSGLGLALAQAWGERKARLALVGRSVERLEVAAEPLRRRGVEVLTLAADVREQEQVDAAVERLTEEFGGLDVLVNCVGVSARGRILDTTPEEFSRLLEINLLGPVRCTRAAMPLLLASRGSVVNIGSLAGKSASRFIGAYPASKFALSAYTQQLRLEMAGEGVHVLLVSPGPIAREDAGSRYDEEGVAGLPPSARKPGGGVKLKGIPADWLAEQIVKACDKRRSELVVPGRARFLFAIQQLWPTLGDWIVDRMTR